MNNQISLSLYAHLQYHNSSYHTIPSRQAGEADTSGAEAYFLKEKGLCMKGHARLGTEPQAFEKGKKKMGLNRMPIKKMPFSKTDLERIAAKFPTPFHIYEEKGIRKNARDLLKAFGWNDGFKEYFAVKATPNPFILEILKSEGLGTDCSSLPELLLSEKVGIIGTDIMFSSNDTPAEEFRKARGLNAIINLDDISHIPFLEKNGGITEIISVRYNPGRLREGSFIMGSPENAKYGFTREQIFTGLSDLRQKGSRKFGLHTFIASNELNPDYFVDTADMLFDLAIEIKEKLRIRLEFINLSGGIGIPYKPDQKRVDLAYMGEEIRKKYQEKIRKNGLHPISIFMECGRAITGPCGYLVSRVLHKKEIYKTHIGLDANMANSRAKVSPRPWDST